MISYSRTIIILIFLFSAFLPLQALGQPPVKAEKKQTISHPAPNWVHPELRQQYPGYKKQKEQKKNSNIWKYSTNRPLGNIKGGGSTQYNDYKPFYRPPPKKKKNNREVKP